MSKTQKKELARRALESDAAAEKRREGIWDRMTGGGPIIQRDLTHAFAGAAREIDITAIVPDPKQPRKTMDPVGLEELADSIRANGILQPITVTWSDKEAGYLILTGQRRFEAAKLAGLSLIPAIIKATEPGDRERLQQQLVENLQRENIPPIEEAYAMQTLLSLTGQGQRETAKALGKGRTYINELLTILKIEPKLLARAADKKLPKRALVDIAKAATPAEQEQLMQAALESKTPYVAVQRERTKATEKRDPRFPYRYPVKDMAASVTVTFDTEPKHVAKEVAKVLSSVIEQLSENKPEKKAGGKAGRA